MRLNRPISQILVLLYLAGTFGLRFAFEYQLSSNYWISLLTGFLCLLFFWAVIKSGWVNPGWFWFEKEFQQEKEDAEMLG